MDDVIETVRRVGSGDGEHDEFIEQIGGPVRKSGGEHDGGGKLMHVVDGVVPRLAAVEDTSTRDPAKSPGGREALAKRLNRGGEREGGRLKELLPLCPRVDEHENLPAGRAANVRPWRR